MYVFDLESNGLLENATQIWCGVFKNVRTGRVYKFTPPMIDQMVQWLEIEQPHLIGHNVIQFDLPLLQKLTGYEHKGGATDTLLISKLHKPDRLPHPRCPNKGAPHALENWGYRVGRGKPEHKEWSRFSRAMLHRCSEDVEITLLTHYALQEEAKGYNWESAYKLTHKLFEITHKQQEYGFLIDEDRLYTNICILSRWQDRINKVLKSHLPYICIPEETKVKGEYKFVAKPFLKSGHINNHIKKWMSKNGIDLNIRGPFCRLHFRRVDLDKAEELKTLLLSLGWKPKEWNTNDLGEQTSPKLSHKDNFEGVEGKVGSLMCKYIICKHRKSQLEGFIKRIRDDGRLSGIVSGLATTGRAKHKTIVNVPGGDSFFGKQMRKIFTCKPGYVLVGTDAAGCQNRMLAARVGDEFFTKTLIEGKKEDKTSIHYVNQKAFADRGYKIEYNMCKNLNYGTLFGASNAKLGRMIGGSPDDGQQIREAILGVAPGFQGLMDSLTNEWRSRAKMTINKWGKPTYKNGWITGLDGRPIFIENEHTILVYMLQSDEAIMMSAAYCFLYKWAEAKGWKHGRDWGYTVWMHDEYQAEVKEEIVEEFAELAEKAIVKAGEFYKIACPQKGESIIGRNWYETH